MLMEQVLIGDNPPPKCDDPNILKKLSVGLYWTLLRYALPAKDKDMGKHFATRPMNLPLTKSEKDYALEDVEHLLTIQKLQEYRLTKLDLMRVAFLENNVVQDTIGMRVRGIRVNQSILKAIESDNRKQYNEIIKRLPPSVQNWNSPAQVKKYFTSIGIPLSSFEVLNDDFIEKYNNEDLTKFYKARQLSTAISKYGSKFLIDKDTGKSFVSLDGRVRADFRQILNTGRFAVFKPPLHGLPREGNQRAAFIPAKGKVFVIGDFSGQENGVAAAASKEEFWIKTILRGDDLLSLIASIMFTDWSKGMEKGCTFPNKCNCKQHKKQRQDVKEINYGMIYGATPKSVSLKIKRTQPETFKLFVKHKKTSPNLNRWLQRNAKESIQTRISYSADTYRRRRTIRDPEEWMVRNVGFNNPVQSCAANMIKLAMISLQRFRPCIVFVWHDELILEVDKRDGKAACKELKMVMEKAADYCTGVKGLIKVEPRIATNLLKQ
jgi:DNA polymerase I-like protein with 3'-5' exonuclease and polymerase domains